MLEMNRKTNKRNFSLAGILSSTTETNASYKIAKKTITLPNSPTLNANESKSPDWEIAAFLSKMREKLAEFPTGTIEVELRFGQVISHLHKTRFASTEPATHSAIVLSKEEMAQIGAKFQPGVAKEVFQKYRKYCDGLTKPHHPSKPAKYVAHEEIQQVLNLPHSRRVIIEQDLQTGQHKDPYMQKKERLGSLDIFLPRCQYDARVSISVESPNISLANGLKGLSAVENERHKSRHSAIGKQLQVDLTTVKTGDTDEETFEVEFELTKAVVEEWLECEYGSKEEVVKCRDNASHIWNMMQFFLPESGQAFKTNWYKNDLFGQYRSYYMSLFNGYKDRFPGTMPVGFARRDIPRVNSQMYWVSEKTDGVRYFLVVGHETAYLVDRTNTPFTAPGVGMLSMILPEGTVLDGEFVMHQGLKRYIFSVFDVLATGRSSSESHISKLFEDRLAVLNDFLSDKGPYAKKKSDISFSSLLLILRKKWVPSTQIKSVFKSIGTVKMPDNSIGRVYKDDKRMHFTDGIVFCPNTKYHPGTHSNYLKWKWCDLVTIDFHVSTSIDGRFNLSCAGPNNCQISLDSLVEVDKKDHDRILKVLGYSNGNAILEFGFCLKTGLWKYKCHRSDKDRCNYINSVMGSLMNIAEGISQEELRSRLSTCKKLL